MMVDAAEEVLDEEEDAAVGIRNKDVGRGVGGMAAGSL